MLAPYKISKILTRRNGQKNALYLYAIYKTKNSKSFPLVGPKGM